MEKFASTSLLESEVAAGPLLRGRGYRVRLQILLIDFYFRTFLAFEQVFGPVIIPAMVWPLAAWDKVIRRRDYPQFVKLHDAMPEGFWKGLSAAQHYRDMALSWFIAGGMILSYGRLGASCWQKRFVIKGMAPWEHPEAKTRPVVLAFMHTGLFAALPFWLRSRGIPAACVWGGLPFILDNSIYKSIREQGDCDYGVEGVPLFFRRRGPAVRDAIRFLQPGHVLGMALDGGRMSAEFDQYDAGGFPFFAKQGAARIGAQTNAIVMPVSIRRTKGMHFEVRFGRPVPDEILQDNPAATQHLVTELWADLKNEPGDLYWTTLEAATPSLRVDRHDWL